MTDNRYQSKITHLAEPEFGRAKRIRVWEYKDTHHKCYEFYINPNRLRTWNSILYHITHVINPNFGAIRNLVSIKKKTLTQSFDDLDNNGKYMAIGVFNNNITFVKHEYKTLSEIELAKKKKNKHMIHCKSNSPEYEFLRETHKRNLTIIYILINGISRQLPAKVVLTERDLQAWDVSMEYITKILDVPDGIEYLCTVNGDVVLHPDDLQHGNLYIGVPFNEKFNNKLNYMHIFNEWEPLKKNFCYVPKTSLVSNVLNFQYNVISSKKATVKREKTVQKPPENIDIHVKSGELTQAVQNNTFNNQLKSNTSTSITGHIINRTKGKRLPEGTTDVDREVTQMRRSMDTVQIGSKQRSKSTPEQITTEVREKGENVEKATNETNSIKTQTSHNTSVSVGSKRILLNNCEEDNCCVTGVDDDLDVPGCCEECDSLDSITHSVSETRKVTADDAGEIDDTSVSNEPGGSTNICSEFLETCIYTEKDLEITDSLSISSKKSIQEPSKHSSIVEENEAGQDDNELISIIINISKSSDNNKISTEDISVINYLHSNSNLDSNDFDIANSLKSSKESIQKINIHVDGKCSRLDNENIESIDDSYKIDNTAKSSNHNSITEKIDSIKDIINEILLNTYQNAMQTEGMIAESKYIESTVNSIITGIGSGSGTQQIYTDAQTDNYEKEKYCKQNTIKECDISEDSIIEKNNTIAKSSKNGETASLTVKQSPKNGRKQKGPKTSSEDEKNKSFTSFSASKKSHNSDRSSSGGISAALSENNMGSSYKRIPSIHIRNRTDINFCDHSKSRKSSRRNKVPQKSSDNKSFSNLEETFSTTADNKQGNNNDTDEGCFCPYGPNLMAHKSNKIKEDQTENVHLKNSSGLCHTTMVDDFRNPIFEVNGDMGVVLKPVQPCCSIISIDSIEDVTRS